MDTAAAIDIGSNAIRMLFADLDPNGRVRPRHVDRHAIRLGAEAFSLGRIREETVARLEQAFIGFRETLDREGVKLFRAVGTSALREAVNGQECVERIAESSNIPIDIISGEEEASLVYLAVRSACSLGDEPVLLVEIGGGSIEVSVTEGGKLAYTECLPLGTVRLLQLSEKEGFSSRVFQRLVREYVRGASLKFRDRYRTFQRCIGTGGNCDELVSLRKQVFGSPSANAITLDEIQQLREILEGTTIQERQERFGLRPDRADVILPATVVLSEVLRTIGVTQLELPRVGLKEGLILDLLGQGALEDSPQRTQRRSRALSSARELGRRFLFDEPHGDIVARHAVSLFRQLQPLHNLPERFELLLEIAGLLHDIGQSIHHREHHKHSYYILLNTSLSGISPRDQKVIAALARYHRKAAPKPKHEAYSGLDLADRRPVEILSAILRIADALDRQHRGVIDSVTVLSQAPELLLGVTAHDTYKIESEALVAKSELFCSLFGGTVAIEKHA